MNLRPDHGPPLDHDGTMTVWKFTGGDEAAEMVEASLREFGVRVQRYVERETPEQHQQRQGGR